MNHLSNNSNRQFTDSELDQAFSGAIESLGREGFIFSNEKEIVTTDETEKMIEREQVESITGELRNFSEDMLQDEENITL